MLISSFSSHVCLAVELVSCSRVYRDQSTMVCKKLLQTSPVSAQEVKGQSYWKAGGKRKKVSPTMLQAFLVQDSFLTVTNCKTPAESNTSLACM